MTAALYWNAMFCAPRDGREIIVIHSDLSGVRAVHWEAVGDGVEGPGWYDRDGDWVRSRDSELGGWIEMPPTSPIVSERDHDR